MKENIRIFKKIINIWEIRPLEEEKLRLPVCVHL